MKLALFLFGLTFFVCLFHYIKFLLKYMLINTISDVTNQLISLRLVSAIQAIIACSVGVIVISNCAEDVIHDRHWLATGYTLFGTPYLLYDLWAMYRLYCLQHPEILVPGVTHSVIQYVKHNKVMTGHHVLFPLFYFPLVVWIRGDIGDFFVGCIYLFELAIPFISIRAILKQLGLNNTTCGRVNGILLVITFFICRILIFPFMYHAYGRQHGYTWYQVPSHIPTKCTLGCLGLLAPQVYWQIQMIIIFYRTVRRICSKSKDDMSKYSNGISDGYEFTVNGKTMKGC